MARDLFAEAGISVGSEGRDLFAESGVTPKKPKDRDALDVIKDIGITGLKGATSLPESVVGLVDIPAGGSVGKALEDIGYNPRQAKEYLDTFLSPAQQEANAKVREAEGFTDTLATAVQNPSTIAATTLESLPSMLGGAGLARFGLKVAPRIGAVAAGAMGEGAIGAGSAAEQIRSESADGTLTAKQSLSAIGSGIGTGVLGFAGGKLAQKLGVADVDTLLAQGGPRATAQGFVSQVGKAGMSEGAFEELPQSMQEQMWQNFATGKPIMEGVGNAAATGLLAGAAMGGVGGGYNYVANRKQGAADPAQPVPNVTVVGAPDQVAEQPLETAPPQPVDPLNRLAEIELASQQRQLTADEQQEAANLLTQITAQEQDQPTDLNQLGINQPTEQQNGAQAQEAIAAEPRQPAEVPVSEPVSVNAPAALSEPAASATAKSVAPLAVEPVAAPQPAPAAVQTDLQNRDRARTASVIQMAGIAKNPDYMRLGPSRTPDSGAPMVFTVDDAASLIKPEATGNEDVAVMADGQRVPFRYAVVDANAVHPSNFADGSVNPEFASKVPGTIKALNNGRTAGIRAAHENGKADNYVRELVADTQTHGIPADVIAKTKNPMLVRVYSDASNTENMAAKSQGQGLGMSPAELAAQDAPMLDSSLIGLYQPVDITHGANRDFVRGFIGKLAGAGQDVAGFLTADGTLSPMGRNRIQAALVQRAYGDADLVETMFDSLDSDIKTIGEVLKLTAGGWANMRDSAEIGAIDPQVDITGNLLQAVNMIRTSRETRQSLYEMTRQASLETGSMPDPLTIDVLRLFYTGTYLTRAKGRERVLDVLGKYIQAAMETRGDAGLFGDSVSPLDILEAINDQPEETTGAGQTLGLPLSSNPAGGNAVGGRQEAQRPVGNEGRGAADSVGNGQSGQDAQTAAEQQNGDGNPQGQEGDAPTDNRSIIASEGLQNFGKELEGGRRNRAPSLDKDLSDDEIAGQPLSKIWPADEINGIEDKFAAAVAFAARAEIPAKPRVGYRVANWAQKVQTLRQLAAGIVRVGSDKARDIFAQAMKGSIHFRAKVALLEAVDRDQWSRIGNVYEYPNSYSYLEDGTKVPAASVSVEIDGKNYRFSGAKSVTEEAVLNKVNELLGQKAEDKKMAFEVRGRTGSYFINKKGDKEYRKLKTFADSREAFSYIKENYADLVAAWDAVKERDNVGKADVRNAENRPRTGKDWLQGKDVTAQQFIDDLGFRGVEFGKWVDQGVGAKERQGMLNQAYEALMDLATIVGVPPKAISLNGSMGLAFGSRGSGSASAHFEPSNLVINLTKTRGAGTLAHEWFHALDNYFARMRGGEKTMKDVGSQAEYRRQNYVTYKPEPLLVHKTKRFGALTMDQLQRYHEQNPKSSNYDPANWEADPKHPEGVRPVVEKAFSDLVKTLNDSPMAKRASLNDKGADGYWGRIIERAARSFENYVIHKMDQDGYQNDYLANVVPIKDFQRDEGRYPYLRPEEVKPVADAFDRLFKTVETKKTDDGHVTMFSRSTAKAPGQWYQSKLETAIDQAPDRVFGKAAQFKLWLASNAAKLGIKKEEIEWSGINEFLDLRQGSNVPKQDLLEFLSNNSVKVQDVMKHNAGKDLYVEESRDEEGTWLVFDADDNVIEAFDSRKSAEGFLTSATKYGSYTLPGGTNYKELLLTLPIKVRASTMDEALAAWKEDARAGKRGVYTESEIDNMDVDNISDILQQEYMTPNRRDQFRSSHWDEPNILAHVRFNDRVDADGNKVLFIEEIQSDWAQAGRKQGFSDTEKARSLNAQADAIERNNAERFEKMKALPPGSDEQNSLSDEWIKANVQAADLRQKASDIFKAGNVPPAPFVKDTKAWVALAIKRMVAYAAENGYAKVAFVNGEQSAERYDLSKQIDKVEYTEGGALYAWDKSGNEVMRKKMPESEVEDHIGKDLAVRLLSAEKGKYNSRSLSGADIKVGGEGMKSFYDKIVPQVANDVLKKLGGGKVEPLFDVTRNTQMAAFPEGNQWVVTDAEDGSVEHGKFDTQAEAMAFIKASRSAQLGFTITPEMREKVSQGLPLFSRGKTGGSMAIRDLNAIVTRAKKSLANLPNVRVFSKPEDLSLDDPAQKRLYDSIVSNNALEDVEGATHEGEIYLFAKNIADEFRAEHVLVNHEVGHYGLRAVFGTDIDPIMNNIWMSNAAVRKKVNALRNKYGLDSNVVATEEVLVEMAPEDLTKLKGWRRLVQYVRNWLNDHGFKSLASQLDKLSKAGLSDQQKADLVVADVVNAARSWVRSGRTGRLATVVDTKLSASGNNSDVDQADADIRFSRSTLGNDEAVDTDPTIATRYEQARAKIKALTNPENYDDLIYNYQDKFIDLKRLREKIKATKGTISDLNDAYLGEELYHGRVATRVNEFEDEELKPLLAELRASGIGIEEFERFLHARHAPEANAAMAEANPTQAMIDEGRKTASDEVKALRDQLDKSTKAGSATKDIERSLSKAIDDLNRWSGAQAFAGTEEERLALSGMSDQEAEQIMAGYNAQRRTQLDKLANKIDAINAKTLSLQLQYGLSDQETIKAWQGKYQHYVPLHRDEAHPDSKSHPIGQGFSVKGQESRRRVGSNAKVTNILAHIAMQRNAAITRGEKNTVAKKLYLLAAQNPDNKFWTLERPKRSYIDPRTGFVVRDVDPNYKNLPNVVMLKIGGVDTAIVFNEHNPNAVRLAAAMKNLDMDSVDGLLKLAQKGTRWFASINTQYNPVFGVINLARDVQGAVLNLSTTAIAGKQKEIAKELPAAMRAIYRTERGKDATKATKEYQALWREYQEMGGATGYRELFSDAKERQKDIVKKLGADDATGVWAGSKRLFKTAYGYSIGPTVEWINDYNTAMENAVRLAAYKVAIDSGISKERAASIGKNLTVNFNRKGAKSGTISALYAFFNASMQGTARMAQTLAGPMGRKIMYGGVLLGAMDTLLSMAVMGGEGDDDDNYAKIPDFVKERSFIIPVSRDQFVSIPMPLGYNVFPNIGRIAVEMAMGKNEKTAGQHLGNLMLILAESFNPIGTSSTLAQTLAPTVIDLPLALIENKDWTGRTIYRENNNPQNPKPGFTMAKDSASFLGKESAKAINDLTGGNAYRPGWFSPSPDQIDYVIGQLTGGVGREAMKLEQSLSSMVTGDELPAYKIPLVGRLYGNTRGPAGNAEQFYRNNREINMIENEAKGRAKDGLNPYEFLNSEPLGKLVGLNNAIDNQIQNLRRLRREVVRQDPPDRKARVEQINQQIGDAMRRLNAEVTQVKKEPAKK